MKKENSTLARKLKTYSAVAGTVLQRARPLMHKSSTPTWIRM